MDTFDLTQFQLGPLLGTDLQLGYVVRDLDKAMRHWVEVMGVGPWLHLDKGTGRPPAPSINRGLEQVIETRLGFAYFGQTQIELIEQVNDAPSIYREFLDSRGEGLQHFGFAVPDFARAHRGLISSGYRVALEIPVAGHAERITYFEAPNPQDVMIEIVPPAWRAARAKVKAHLAQCREAVSYHETYASFLASQD